MLKAHGRYKMSSTSIQYPEWHCGVLSQTPTPYRARQLNRRLVPWPLRAVAEGRHFGYLTLHVGWSIGDRAKCRGNKPCWIADRPCGGQTLAHVLAKNWPRCIGALPACS